MRKKNKIVIQVMGLILFISIFSYLLYIYEVEKILSSLGISNPYYFIFFLSIVAGTSIFTSTTVYFSIISLAAADFSFFLLGISAGMGLFVGDTLYYYLGEKFAQIDYIRSLKMYGYLSNLVKRMNHKTMNVFVFLYATFSPFPNDILMILFGGLKIRYWVFASSLLLGNVFFMILIALFGTYIVG